MAAAAKTYLVTPVSGSEPAYEVKATSYEYERETGRHVFKNGEEIVANVLNVSVRQKP